MGAAHMAKHPCRKHPGRKQRGIIMCCSRNSCLPALFWCETLWLGLMCCLGLAGVLVVLSEVQTAYPWLAALHPTSSAWAALGWEGAGGAACVRRKRELHYFRICKQNALGATFSSPASSPWRELGVVGIVWELGVNQWLRTASGMGMCVSLGHKMTAFPGGCPPALPWLTASR